MQVYRGQAASADLIKLDDRGNACLGIEERIVPPGVKYGPAVGVCGGTS